MKQLKNSVPSICIVSAYFGKKLPNSFDLWLESCRRNPSIDFLFFTDQPISSTAIAANVRIIPLTLEQIRQRASAVLGFEAVIDKGYHLCNYRPMFGVIFRDYLSSYDYWGHCDIDMVLGDIRMFTTQYNIADYDKFLPLGHLSLFRNTEAVNNAYRLDGARKMNGEKESFRDVCLAHEARYFDEEIGIVAIMKKHNFRVFVKRIFADILPLYYRFIRAPHRYSEEIPLPKNYKHQTFYWEDGKVFGAYVEKGKICQKEFIYLHFQKRPNWPIPFEVTTTSGFYITPKGYVVKKGPVTLWDIYSTNPYHWYREVGEKISLLWRKKLFPGMIESRPVLFIRKIKNAILSK